MKNIPQSHYNPRGFALRGHLQRVSAQSMDRLGRRDFQRHHFAVEEITITVSELPAQFEGYRIAHLTDIHLGQWLSPTRLHGVVDLVNELEPDTVAMTGDFVSYLLDEVARDLGSALSKLDAPDGTTAVLGNHDHWTDADRVRELLAESGASVLDNDFVSVNKEGASLHFGGVDCVMVGKDRLDQLLERMPVDSPAILLAHEPDFADTSAATGRFALQLSGHSHGTQVVLPGGRTVIRGPHFRNYPIGRYEIEEMTLYTNRGLGTNVFWTRLNCPPEIAMITLRSASPT